MCGLKYFICFGKSGGIINSDIFSSLFSVFTLEIPITFILAELILFHWSLILLFFHFIFSLYFSCIISGDLPPVH